MQLISAIRLRQVIDNEWLLAIAGMASIAFGVPIAAAPGDGALALLWVIGFYAIFFGVSFVALGLRLRGVEKGGSKMRQMGASARAYSRPFLPAQQRPGRMPLNRLRARTTGP